MAETVFGYRHVSGIPLCPCRDPGNYVMMETVDGVDRLRCWCGATTLIQFDDETERRQFIASATKA